jgi:3-methyladenine DNA glycosylase Tag
MPNGKPIITYHGPQVSTPESDAISKDMKKGKFFGTTICYAHMQATGWLTIIRRNVILDNINCTFEFIHQS